MMGLAGDSSWVWGGSREWVGGCVSWLVGGWVAGRVTSLPCLTFALAASVHTRSWGATTKLASGRWSSEVVAQ